MVDCRNSDNASVDLPKDGAAEPDQNDDIEFFIPDSDTLAQQMEKYCIQCLVLLGEYVEVLGPVLHEKGVDVSLALLQRYSKEKKESEIVSSLPEVLKLICALAAHRKFAAVFVDRGGIQKLLAVPRVLHTFFGLSSCLFTIGSLQVIYFSIRLALPIFQAFQYLFCNVSFNSMFVFSFFFTFPKLLTSKHSSEICVLGHHGACLCSAL